MLPATVDERQSGGKDTRRSIIPLNRSTFVSRREPDTLSSHQTSLMGKVVYALTWKVHKRYELSDEDHTWLRASWSERALHQWVSLVGAQGGSRKEWKSTPPLASSYYQRQAAQQSHQDALRAAVPLWLCWVQE